jgi:hypothetical protein
MEEDDTKRRAERRRHSVRLPGFIVEDEVGLGDIVKRVTYAVGIKPCSGCEQRAAALNRWLGFTGRTRHR